MGATPQSRQGPFTRLVSGDGIRKTRLHSYKGERLDWSGLRYLPYSLVTALLRGLFSVRVPLPWISWRAIAELDRLIKPDWTILEFGSGMSSMWLAQRCAKLVTIEHDATWFDVVNQRFKAKGLSHVTYLRRKDDAHYGELNEYPPGTFDFALIDGVKRDACVREALKRVKPGGYLYLDNSDVTWNEIADAEALLIEAVKNGGSYRYYTDLFPGSIAVSQGLLVRLPGGSDAR